MSIRPPFPELQQYPNLNLKIWGQGHGLDLRSKSYRSPASDRFASLSFHDNRNFRFGDMASSKGGIEHPRLRSWIGSKVIYMYCETCCFWNICLWNINTDGVVKREILTLPDIRISLLLNFLRHEINNVYNNSKLGFQLNNRYTFRAFLAMMKKKSNGSA